MSRFNSFDDDDFEEEEVNPDEMDEFDQLRRRSVRTGSAFDELEADEGSPRERPSATGSYAASSASFSMSNFSPGQRMILALLVLLDILAVGFGALVLLGFI